MSARTRVAKAGVVILASAGLVGTTPGSASANPPPGDCQLFTCEDDGDVVILPTDPGSPGTPGGNEGTPTGGGPQVCTDGGQQVPCSLNGAPWSAVHGCYLELTPGGGPPPPFAENPDGAWYRCVGGVLPIWIDAPPAALPSPATVAQTAIERMNLEPIDIGIVPEDGPGRLGVVGMPVYMWVENPAANTFGPIAESATAGTVTVTATARVDSIVWTMGDGNTITCTTDGTPYEDRYGDSDSPDCGHRYSTTSWKQPGHEFTVTATAQWTVEWRGAGQAGVIPIDHTSQTRIRVGEIQVLTQ